MPFTDFNILLELEGNTGAAGARFYWKDGRLRVGVSKGLGSSFGVGFERRGDGDY